MVAALQVGLGGAMVVPQHYQRLLIVRTMPMQVSVNSSTLDIRDDRGVLKLKATDHSL